MQFNDGSAVSLEVEAAITAPVRRMRDLVEIDWNRDGAYSHPYSNVSDIVLSADIERQINGDLPEEVNILTGYSSSEASVKLGGKRSLDELTAVELFSPYLNDSPLYSNKVVGTPIRISKLVTTDTQGEQTVRQFTGWIREFELSRDDSTVTLTCSDIVDLVAKNASLQLWAANTFQGVGAAGAATSGTNRPISATWAVEEILRQAGRPTGPKAKDEAVLYCSAQGSMLPSIGYVSDPVFVTSSVTHSINPYVSGVPWQQGKYGICPKLSPLSGDYAQFSGTTQTWEANYAEIRTSRRMDVPRSGSGRTPPAGLDTTSPATITASFWAYTDPSSSSDRQVCLWSFLDHFYSGFSSGSVLFRMLADGRMVIQAQDSNTTIKSWVWGKTTGLPAAGWHYHHMNLTFTTSSVTASYQVDGVSQTLTNSSNPGGGFQPPKASGGEWLMTVDKTNITRVYADIPSQFLQMCHARNTTLGYTAGEELPPTTVDGKPLAKVTQTLTELNWIPSTSSKNAWTLLGDIANSEFGVVYTDEFGTVNYSTNYEIRNDLPATVGVSREISDDRLLGMTVNPTVDQYRNTVSASRVKRGVESGFVWTPGDPGALPAAANTSYSMPLGLNEVVAIDTYPVQVLATADVNSTDPASANLRRTAASAVYLNNVNSDATSGGGFYYGIPTRGSDNYTLTYYGGTSGNGVYLGCNIGGTKANMHIFGYKYGERDIVRTEGTNSAEVALNGRRVLTLPDNDWLQTDESRAAIISSVLNDVVNPVPIVDGIKIPCDPRLQLRDVLAFTGRGITGKLYGQVRGIKRDLGNDEDTLTIRVIATPGEWSLGDTGLSELGQTTVLG